MAIKNEVLDGLPGIWIIPKGEEKKLYDTDRARTSGIYTSGKWLKNFDFQGIQTRDFNRNNIRLSKGNLYNFFCWLNSR